MKRILKRIHAIFIPDMLKSGRAGRDAAIRALDTVTDALESVENVLFYPSGRIYKNYREERFGAGQNKSQFNT